MKKIITVLAVTLILLVGCGSSNTQTSASLPEGYMAVTQDEFENHMVTVIQHRDTGCYFTTVQNYSYDSGVAITQMYVERNGVSVPYCELFSD